MLIGETSVKEAQNFKTALSKLENVRFHIAYDGGEIVQYLRGEGKFSNRVTYPFPSWMILHFQLPGHSALEIMRWIRDHVDCNIIPILLFSDAPTPDEVAQAYQCRVNSVFKKPQTLPEMEQLFAALINYWRKAELPQPPPTAKCP